MLASAVVLNVASVVLLNIFAAISDTVRATPSAATAPTCTNLAAVTKLIIASSETSTVGLLRAKIAVPPALEVKLETVSEIDKTPLPKFKPVIYFN